MAFWCFWQQEYLFMPKLMIAKNRKGNNMSNGLLVMYVFLALIIAGSLIYSKWEDKHQQQEQ
jgi:hypothetical protein